MKKNGFTLIELLVVIAIVGLLAAVVAMNVGGSDDKVKWKLSQTELKKLKGHVELFKMEQNRYPERLEELLLKRHVEQIPQDMWGRSFAYRTPGERGAPFDVVCWGADGVPGGTEWAEDIWSHPPSLAR